jgi:hypothetical protein
MYVIDVNDPEYGAVVSLLRAYFNVANGRAFINQPIYISGDDCCKRAPLVYLILILYIIN